MYVFDYVSDIGREFKRIKPKIDGRNLVENLILSSEDCLLILSNWIDTADFNQTPKESAVCPISLRMRKLLYQDNQYLIQVDYPLPFLNLDFQLFNNNQIKIKTIPEFISHPYLNIFLNQLP